MKVYEYACPTVQVGIAGVKLPNTGVLSTLIVNVIVLSMALVILWSEQPRVMVVLPAEPPGGPPENVRETESVITVSQAGAPVAV